MTTIDDAGIAGRYAFIDAVPDVLLDAVVANAHGRLRPRAEAIVVLRDALLAGRLPRPRELGWPETALRQSLLDALERSGVVAHCAANSQITDEVLAGVLGATDVAQKHYDELLAEWTLAARERDKRTRIVGLVPGDGEPGEVLFDEAAWRRLRDEAVRMAGKVALEALAEHQKVWDEQRHDWGKLRELLGDLCEASACDPGRLPGMLHAIDWRRSAELRSLFAGLPAMRSLVKALGRRRAPDAPSPEAFEVAGGVVQRPVVVEQEVRELGQVEVRGVERSDEVSRMLASEAMLRLLPVTRRLWHARRAERALLTYHAESLYTTRITTEEGFRDGVVVRHERAERGPVIILLDSSGSMAGRAEIVARAVILQVMCVCELEGRPCYLYNFSGSGDLVEHELTFERDGLARAIAVMTVSFSGGTVIDEPLRRAVHRVQSKLWAGADVLIVTDGLLGPSDCFDGATLRMVARARRGTPFRIHFALTSSFGGVGNLVDDECSVVRELADEIHDLDAWVGNLVPSN